MDSFKKWCFSKQELALKCSENGIGEDKDLQKRQETASRILNMGKLLDLSGICIHTAIVYMHRFYIHHSFEKIHRYDLMNAALLLAAQVHGMPITLVEVVKCCYTILYPTKPALDVNSEAFMQMRNKAKLLAEGDLLETLGPELEVEDPHRHIMEICKFVKAHIDLHQAANFVASLSLRKTTMCLQYEPHLIACMSIHFASKWAGWKINPYIKGKEWYRYVDENLTFELLENMTEEFYGVLKHYPHLLGAIPRNPGASCHSQKYAINEKHHSKDKQGVIEKKVDSALPGNVDKLTNSLDAGGLTLASPPELSNRLDLKHSVPPTKDAEPASVTNSQIIKEKQHKRRLNNSKDVDRLPVKKQKHQSSIKVESTEQPVSIKTSKSPVPLVSVTKSKPRDLTIVIFKDKSGVYHSEYKKERHARKYKRFYEIWNRNTDDTTNKENSSNVLNQANDHTDAKNCIGK